jgi:type II secretory pathway component PulF
MDDTTFAFAMFVIGAIIGVVLPKLSAMFADSPAVQQWVGVVSAILALIAAAVTQGQIVAPAFFGGIIAGYIYAISALQTKALETTRGMRLSQKKEEE